MGSLRLLRLGTCASLCVRTLHADLRNGEVLHDQLLGDHFAVIDAQRHRDAAQAYGYRQYDAGEDNESLNSLWQLTLSARLAALPYGLDATHDQAYFT